MIQKHFVKVELLPVKKNTEKSKWVHNFYF